MDFFWIIIISQVFDVFSRHFLHGHTVIIFSDAVLFFHWTFSSHLKANICMATVFLSSSQPRFRFIAAEVSAILYADVTALSPSRYQLSLSFQYVTELFFIVQHDLLHEEIAIDYHVTPFSAISFSRHWRHYSRAYHEGGWLFSHQPYVSIMLPR